MGDNSIQTGADTIRDKDRAGVKTQIFGMDVGIGTATEALMSAANPMPIYGPDALATGTITTTDAVVGVPSTAGAFVSGASTAGSLVSIATPGGDTAWNAQVTGLTTGTLYFEASLDSTTGTDGNWVAVNGRQTGVVNTVLGTSATTNGMWRGNTSGIRFFRIRSVGALTGTPAIRINLSDGTGAVFLNASIPAGANTIGTVGSTPATTGTGSSAALAITSFTVLAANTARKMATFYNDSVNVLYLGLFATTSTTAHTVQVPAGGYYELPGSNTIYTGIVTAISAVASGSVRVTELV